MLCMALYFRALLVPTSLPLACFPAFLAHLPPTSPSFTPSPHPLPPCLPNRRSSKTTTPCCASCAKGRSRRTSGTSPAASLRRTTTTMGRGRGRGSSSKRGRPGSQRCGALAGQPGSGPSSIVSCIDINTLLPCQPCRPSPLYPLPVRYQPPHGPCKRDTCLCPCLGRAWPRGRHRVRGVVSTRTAATPMDEISPRVQLSSGGGVE